MFTVTLSCIWTPLTHLSILVTPRVSFDVDLTVAAKILSFFFSAGT